MRLKFAGLSYGHWASAALIAGMTGTGPEVLSRHTGWPRKPLRTGQAPGGGGGAEEGGSSRKASISALVVFDKRKKDGGQQIGGDFSMTAITAAIKREQSEGESIVFSDGQVLCWVDGQPSVQVFVCQRHCLLIGYLVTDLVRNCSPLWAQPSLFSFALLC